MQQTAPLTTSPRLPLSVLRESPTNPRTTFTGLDEMAATIRTTGVVQALIVRPLAKPERKVTHEIVAGARRFRASQLAGITDVPVDIRTLTDDQAIDIQQIENLQREDLTPLEEAQAYLAMLSRTGQSINTIATRVGKTAKHIAARLSLLNLIDDARKALDEGRIGIPHALKIAPLPKPAQAGALEACFSEHWDRGPIQALLPVTRLDAWIQRMVLRALTAVPFDKSANDLVPSAGSCDECQKRTGANALLFPDSDGDSCLDEACLKAKIEAHVQRTVTVRPELVQVSTTTFATRKDGPVGVKDYINIVEPQKKPRSGTDPARIKCDYAREAIVTEGHDRGAIRLVCADPSCKVHHAKPEERTGGPAEQQRQQTRDEEREKRLKMATRRAIGDAILAKFKQPTAADWQLIASSSARHIPHEYRIDLAKRIGCYPKSKQPGSTEILEAIEKHIAKLDSTGCMRLLFDIALLPDIRSQWSTNADGNLKKVASRFRIDTAAIGKTVRAQASIATKRASTKRKKGAA